MDSTYPISPTLWDIRWWKHRYHPRRNQRHGIVHTYIILSIPGIWSRRCTTMTSNLQHGISTSVWGATKNCGQYSSWIPAPPLQVWTPLFQAPQANSKVGHYPKKFEKCDTPICATCIYAKSTNKPLRGRSRKTPHKSLQFTNPGQIVSVYQLVSPIPGIVAQMTGILNTKRYN